MSDYTPTTADVRGAYATHQGARYRGRKYLDLRSAEFDRWLEQVRAEAWDEGHESAALRIPEGVWHDVAAPHPGNPYRQEQDQ